MSQVTVVRSVIKQTTAQCTCLRDAFNDKANHNTFEHISGEHGAFRDREGDACLMASQVNVMRSII